MKTKNPQQIFRISCDSIRGTWIFPLETVKQWLQYLLNKPLYKQYHITVDESFLAASDGDTTLHNADYSVIETIRPDPDNEKELLLAQQKTLMWSEDQKKTRINLHTQVGTSYLH